MTLSSLLKRFRLLGEVPLFTLRASFNHGVHPVSAVRAMCAALRCRYWPEEAYHCGLLLPGANAATDTRFISKARMVKLQRRINPPAWEFVLSDKGIFDRWATAAGLSVPRVYCRLSGDGSGSTYSGSRITTSDAWHRFFLEEVPANIVVKQARSAYGRSVRLYRRHGMSFSGFDGTHVPWDRLYAKLQDGGDSDTLVQERVFPHPAIVELTGSQALQTVRIVTVTGHDGAVTLVNTFFKAVVGKNEIDNFRHGRTGNLACTAAFADGALGPGVTFAAGGGLREVETHPDTGRTFRGFRLPGWQDACDLVRRAAQVFLPIRLIGFDVALTPDGPVLIEGNFWGDPPTLTWPCDDVMATLRRSLGEHLFEGV